jgi:DNA-binding NarL/FixJ family response regulator
MKIAILEDDGLLALDLESLCETFGHDVIGTARCATEASRRFGGAAPDILLSDMDLGDQLDGVDAVELLRRSVPKLEVVFVTGTEAPGNLRRMRAIRPRAILPKPVRPEALRMALEPQGDPRDRRHRRRASGGWSC